MNIAKCHVCKCGHYPSDHYDIDNIWKEGDLDELTVDYYDGCVKCDCNLTKKEVEKQLFKDIYSQDYLVPYNERKRNELTNLILEYEGSEIYTDFKELVYLVKNRETVEAVLYSILGVFLVEPTNPKHVHKYHFVFKDGKRFSLKNIITPTDFLKEYYKAYRKLLGKTFKDRWKDFADSIGKLIKDIDEYKIEDLSNEEIFTIFGKDATPEEDEIEEKQEEEVYTDEQSLEKKDEIMEYFISNNFMEILDEMTPLDVEPRLPYKSMHFEFEEPLKPTWLTIPNIEHHPPFQEDNPFFTQVEMRHLTRPENKRELKTRIDDIEDNLLLGDRRFFGHFDKILIKSVFILDNEHYETSQRLVIIRIDGGWTTTPESWSDGSSMSPYPGIHNNPKHYPLFDDKEIMLSIDDAGNTSVINCPESISDYTCLFQQSKYYDESDDPLKRRVLNIHCFPMKCLKTHNKDKLDLCHCPLLDIYRQIKIIVDKILKIITTSDIEYQIEEKSINKRKEIDIDIKKGERSHTWIKLLRRLIERPDSRKVLVPDMKSLPKWKISCEFPVSAHHKGITYCSSCGGRLYKNRNQHKEEFCVLCGAPLVVDWTDTWQDAYTKGKGKGLSQPNVEYKVNAMREKSEMGGNK